MITSDHALATGRDATVLTLVENIITYAPQGKPIPLGSVRRRTLNQAIQSNGTVVVTWYFAAMRWTDFQTLILFIFGSWTTESADLTVDTRGQDNLFHRGNVVADRPVEGTDYQRRAFGDVEDLTLTLRDFQELNGGGGFSTGFDLGFTA